MALIEVDGSTTSRSPQAAVEGVTPSGNLRKFTLSPLDVKWHKVIAQYGAARQNGA